MARFESNHCFLSCNIDLSFDMDESLTLPANFGRQISESESLIGEMPTVCCSDDVCSICMEEFESSGKRIACGHIYHASCISSWLSNCDSCPLCRFNISASGRSRES